MIPHSRSALSFGMMANLARAKAQGKRTSRPPLPAATWRRITELHGQGMSVKRLAKELGVAYGTAWNYVKGTKGTATMP